ncbi:MAG: DNA polymerase III subunit alpha [Fusobacteria bacterium]|nr:DNA polymerase III subunit alpha [Fusobacteriota bacterium]
MNRDYGGFVHLHLHTEYSLFDGVGKIDEYLDRAKELGMGAMAVTDHGNMFCAVSFYQKAIKKGIKPIIGIESYISSNDVEKKDKTMYHLILLAKNNIGYRNLLKLSSYGYTDGFYYKPRIDKTILKKYSDGIIGLSACMHGEIPSYLLQNNLEMVEKSLYEYIDIFGKDDFYIELQANGLKEQEILNDDLFKLAQKHGIKVVATNDVHYVHYGDDNLQDILLCLQTGSKLDDKNRMKIDTDELYFKSKSQMLQKMNIYDNAIENTVEIAKKCNVSIEFGVFKFPEYETPVGFNKISEYLKYLVYKGHEKKYKDTKDEKILERIEYELDVITKMGYSEYFVVVWDFIQFAKQNKIMVGPGRGSAAGSIISYLLDITDIDPIKYNLIFERFLNPQRISMPDIDVDLCNERRQEVINYIVNKYGKDKVSQIITFGTLKSRAAIRDVGRVLGVPIAKIDRLAKMLIDGDDLSNSLKNIPSLQDLYKKDSEIQKVIDYSLRLEGKVRHASIHAAGIVISRKSLHEDVPLYSDNKSNIVSTQYQMKELEDLGLLKMDLLGLKNLSLLEKALIYIEKDKNIKINLDEIKLDDEKTYKLLSKGDTSGVFQLESSGIRNLLKRISPTEFEDIIAILALYRPGPLGSGMVDSYIDAKHKKIEVKYMHPKLEEVLKETHGVILYQEQVMKIANILANYTLAEADLLRRAISKKDFDIMEENKNKFINRASENGVDEKIAENIFILIDKFAGYGFNKSHSAAYALIAYQTAYLKANYTVPYFAALMSSESNNLDKLSFYLEEAKKNMIEILPPDVNKSEFLFKIDNNRIRFGLSAIKHFGDNIANLIVEDREKNGNYMDYEDFVFRLKKNGNINRKHLEAVVLSGALDSLEGNRKQKYEIIDKILDNITKKIDRENDIRQSLFAHTKIPNIKLEYENLIEYTTEEKLNKEKEYLGVYISGHPIDKYRLKLEKFKLDKVSEIYEQNKTKVKIAGIITNLNKKLTKAGQVMAEFTLEDYTASIKVIVFPNKYKEIGHLIMENNLVYIDGEVSKNYFNNITEIKINIFNIKNLDEIEEIKKFKVYILLEGDNFSKSITLKKILKKYKGENETLLAIKQNNKKSIVKLDKEYYVNPTELFILEVEELLGKNTIAIR